MLAKKEHCFAADDFFMTAHGFYRHDPTRLPEAHEDCLRRVEACLMEGVAPVACVHNVFARRVHIEPYRQVAQAAGYRVSEVTCGNRWKNIHAVSERRIQQMAEAWEL